MKVRQISVFDTIVYNGDAFKSLDAVVPKELVIDGYCPDVELEFTMPLRIKENNRFAKRSVALHTIVNNIRSRYRQLKGLPSTRIDYKVEGEITASNLNFVEMQRYSNRQKKGMSMGGLKGTITIKGLDMKSYEYLKIGEIIGAGKQTVFGLGSYIVKELK